MLVSQHIWCCEQWVGSWCKGIPTSGACISHQPGLCCCSLTGPIAIIFPYCPARLISVLSTATTLICLQLLCPLGSTVEWPKSRRFLGVTKIFFLFWLQGVKSSMGRLLFHCLFHHCILQLLACIRIGECVCTLISSPLKCFDVLISWFLGNPKHQRSFLGGRKFIIHCPLPPGWHRSPPPSAKPGHSFFY